jgi:hypothetical protein
MVAAPRKPGLFVKGQKDTASRLKLLCHFSWTKDLTGKLGAFVLASRLSLGMALRLRYGYHESDTAVPVGASSVTGYPDLGVHCISLVRSDQSICLASQADTGSVQVSCVADVTGGVGAGFHSAQKSTEI